MDELGDDDDESGQGTSDEEDEDLKLLNVENLRQRPDLSDRQKQLLNKVDGL